MRNIILLALVIGCRGQTSVTTSADDSVRDPGAGVDSGGGAGPTGIVEPTSPVTDRTDAAPATQPEGPATPPSNAVVGGTCPEGVSAAARREVDDTTGHFVPPGAPHPHACEVDADCRSGPGVNPEDGCCDTGVHNGVYGQAYLAWRAAWLREHCADAECPSLPPPAPPLPCALEGRCCDGRCMNRCP